MPFNAMNQPHAQNVDVLPEQKAQNIQVILNQQQHQTMMLLQHQHQQQQQHQQHHHHHQKQKQRHHYHQQQPQKKKRRQGKRVSFNETILVGICCACDFYDRSAIKNITNVSTRETKELLGAKLRNTPVENWSVANRKRFVERLLGANVLTNITNRSKDQASKDQDISTQEQQTAQSSSYACSAKQGLQGGVPGAFVISVTRSPSAQQIMEETLPTAAAVTSKAGHQAHRAV
jgi:hypothetical protein